LKSGTATINYQTILTIPYAHVIRDDKIQIESSKVIETRAPDAYLLLDGTISDQEYETGAYYMHTLISENLLRQIIISSLFFSLNNLACFTFDDPDVSTPVVFAATTTNGHILFERIFQIEHVTAIRPSTEISMRHINQKNTISSSTVSMAKPFDEFSTDPTTSNNPPDVQSNGMTKKMD
jgi:hypothetical protein